MGAPPGAEAIIGPSTSQLCRMLADCYAEVLSPGDEVIVCETAHESNAGPWMRLAKLGIVVRTWPVGELGPGWASRRMASLKSLLSARTRIVAFPQVSNILGEVIDAKAVTALAHGAGARVVVDGVAYAPHRVIDAVDIGCDWYVYSTYKVFGPHAAVLLGTKEAIAQLTGPNHFFIPRDEVPRKFELGGANHESCAGICALDGYLRQYLTIHEEAEGEPGWSRDRVTRAFAIMERAETTVHNQLMDFLRSRSDVRIIGPADATTPRVCTISFVHASKPSREIALACAAQLLGCRYGNFYAYRLVQALGLNPGDGVIRVSFSHFNTPEEVDRLIRTLREAM
jgi:selenocysteine lyase/cysteine desulfurase